MQDIETNVQSILLNCKTFNMIVSRTQNHLEWVLVSTSQHKLQSVVVVTTGSNWQKCEENRLTTEPVRHELIFQSAVKWSLTRHQCELLQSEMDCG